MKKGERRKRELLGAQAHTLDFIRHLIPASGPAETTETEEKP